MLPLCSYHGRLPSGTVLGRRVDPGLLHHVRLVQDSVTQRLRDLTRTLTLTPDGTW